MKSAISKSFNGKTKYKVQFRRKKDKVHGEVVGMFIKYGNINPDHYFKSAFAKRESLIKKEKHR